MSPKYDRELLMVGMAAKTYRIGNVVRKECHILEDAEITKQNREACETEALVYRILDHHPRIAECLSISPTNDYVELEYYPRNNLKVHLNENRNNITEIDLKRWAFQMVESVAYIHSKGISHADLRLEQWLVDASLNARLSDFDGAGFGEQPSLRLESRRPLGLEIPSHCLPRDLGEVPTVLSDIFALGSSLYELIVGQTPYEGLGDENIERMFQRGDFPSTKGFVLGDIIMRCWKKGFNSAMDIVGHEDFKGH
jgi:serine/threonine protein kinase